MPINSRAKGAQGERECAEALKEIMGWDARRAQQFSGNAGDADLVIPQMPIFAEVKRVQKLNVPQAMDKAAEQCRGKIPVLFHRTNRATNGWLVTVRLTDLEELAKFVTVASKFSQRGQSEAS
jgi:hypothetical protein